MLAEGHQLLRRLVKDFELCPKLCFLQKDDSECQGLADQYCHGACALQESPENYNARLDLALSSLHESLPTFFIRDMGRNRHEQSCILVEKGRFYGMGYLDYESSVSDLEGLKNYLTPYPENDYMRGLVYQFITRWPQKRIDLTVAS